MSRRLAVDKRSKRQNLQMAAGRAGEFGEAEVSRRKAEGTRSCRDAEYHAAGARLGRGGEGSPRPGKHGDCPCLKSGEKDFVRTIHRNVFIDSYYPKLLDDVSEETGNSLSNDSEVVSKSLTSDTLGIGNSLESGSRITFKTVRTAFTKDSASESLADALDLFRYKRVQRPHRVTLQHSSRSRHTLDSRTYTLFSCASDLEPIVHGTVKKAKGPKGGGRREERRSAVEGEEARGEGALSTVDWFAQLYKRIETLEELLQETLVNSFPQKEKGCSGKADRRQKARTPKTKLVVPETSRTLESGDLRVHTAAEEGRESLDTDSELRNIKERVRALEMKLQEATVPGILRSDQPSVGFRQFPTTERNSLVAKPKLKKECCCQFAASEESESTRFRRSNTEVFLTDFCGKEVCHEKTTKKASNDVGDGGTGTASSSVNESDPFACIRNVPVPCGLHGGCVDETFTRFTLGKHSKSCKCLVPTETSSQQVKKHFMAKCKRIKGICDSVINSSKKSSRSNHHLLDISEEYKLSCFDAKESLEKAFRCCSFPEQLKAEARGEANVLYVRLAQENGLAPQRRRRKKARKRRKDLCRKSSITNIGLSEKHDGGALWWASGEAFGDCGGKGSREKKGLPLRSERPASPAAHSSDEEATTGNGRRKLRSSRKPMDVLKRGGRIKIPVLFKEVCRTSKSTELAQKVSNMSIRFVLVEKDSKHPLRKLLKKLSRAASHQKKEQYVFGVRRCCCEDKIHHLSSTCGKKDLRNFIGG